MEDLFWEEISDFYFKVLRFEESIRVFFKTFWAFLGYWLRTASKSLSQSRSFKRF